MRKCNYAHLVTIKICINLISHTRHVCSHIQMKITKVMLQIMQILTEDVSCYSSRCNEHSLSDMSPRFAFTSEVDKLGYASSIAVRQEMMSYFNNFRNIFNLEESFASHVSCQLFTGTLVKGQPNRKQTKCKEERESGLALYTDSNFLSSSPPRHHNDYYNDLCDDPHRRP